jgi:outer membrane protein TolC
VPTPDDAVIQSASPLLRTPQNGSEPAKEDVGKPVQPLGEASVVQSPIPVIAQSRQGNQETPVPEEFNPSANPLLFPTQTEEVQIQRTQPITLQQALELARRNNRELEVGKLTLERAQSALQEALAAEFPTAGVVADFTRTDSAQGELSNERQAQRQLQPPFDQLLGGNEDTVSRSFNGALQLSYDLYTAGRRSATIRAAEKQIRFQELEVERLSEQLRLNVTRAYYDLQQADAQVEISQAAVTDAARSLRDAQLLEQAGLGTQFDVLQAQVSLAGANQDLTRAISQQRISRRQIVRLLSLAQPVEVSAADPIETAGDWELSLEQSIILAYKNRAELEQQLVQRDISEQQRRIALAAVRPQASLSASYNILGVLDDDLTPADGLTLGARLQWNFFDGGAARSRAQQERTNIAIAETRFADQRNQVRFDVEQAFFDLNANKENIQTATFALTQAQESLRLARLRFQAGVGTQADVITQQTELTRARGRRLTAILDYNRALAALQRAVTNLQGSNLFDLP